MALTVALLCCQGDAVLLREPFPSSEHRRGPWSRTHDEELTDVFREIPVLPVVVPPAAVILAVLLWWLRRRGRLTLPRAAVAVAFCVYAAGVVANTVFPVFLDKPGSNPPWKATVVLLPFDGYEVADAAMNVAVFVPLGVLVALVLPRPTWGRVLAVVAASSLAIEVTQYLTAHLLGGGHIADVNDLIWNVVGGALGFALLGLASGVLRHRTPPENAGVRQLTEDS